PGSCRSFVSQVSYNVFTFSLPNALSAPRMNKWQLPFKGQTMIGTHTQALHRRTRLIGAVLTLGAALAMPSWADSFFFNTGNPDGKAGALSRPASPGKIETETADDFVLSQTTVIRG